jgi:hypothetical protein
MNRTLLKSASTIVFCLMTFSGCLPKKKTSSSEVESFFGKFGFSDFQTVYQKASKANMDRLKTVGSGYKFQCSSLSQAGKDISQLGNVNLYDTPARMQVFLGKNGDGIAKSDFDLVTDGKTPTYAIDSYMDDDDNSLHYQGKRTVSSGVQQENVYVRSVVLPSGTRRGDFIVFKVSLKAADEIIYYCISMQPTWLK